VGAGVKVMGGKKLVISGSSTVNFMGEYGVYVGDGVKSAELTGTVIKGQNKGVGVYAVGTEKMTMTLTDVTISEVGAGVYVKRGKSLTIGGENSTISFTGDYGVKVEGLMAAHLVKTRIVGTGSGQGKNNGVSVGVYAVGTKDMTMTLEGVTISKVQTGVVVVAGENLTMTGGSIKEVQTGIDMSGSGKLMVKDRATIEFTDGYGVMVGDKVTAELTETKITGSGTGVYVGGGKVELSEVKIEGDGKGKGRGLYVKQGQLSMLDTTLKNVAEGMTISEGSVSMGGGRS
ncbi:NosD domain-containing protein, partial [Bartonella schoenbuchensis]|uniref:NosD domain-containing protein n=1 Tax=Bartonella schoenbuchensis TaxID=165694 RepID=UPI001ABBD488